MTDVEATVQRYYRNRTVMQRIDDALRAAGVDPERPSHRDLWPFDQLHSRGIVATREHAERAGIPVGMYVLDLGCGLGGASLPLRGMRLPGGRDRPHAQLRRSRSRPNGTLRAH